MSFKIIIWNIFFNFRDIYIYISLIYNNLIIVIIFKLFLNYLNFIIIYLLNNKIIYKYYN